MPSSEVGRERGLLDYHVSLAHPLVRALYILPLGFAGCLQKSWQCIAAQPGDFHQVDQVLMNDAVEGTGIDMPASVDG